MEAALEDPGSSREGPGMAKDGPGAAGPMKNTHVKMQAMDTIREMDGIEREGKMPPLTL